MAGGRGHDPKFFKIVRFSEILMFCQKIFRLFLLVKIKVCSFIRKSLNLAHPTLRCHRTSAMVSVYYNIY